MRQRKCATCTTPKHTYTRARSRAYANNGAKRGEGKKSFCQLTKKNKECIRSIFYWPIVCTCDIHEIDLFMRMLWQWRNAIGMSRQSDSAERGGGGRQNGCIQLGESLFPHKHIMRSTFVYCLNCFVCRLEIRIVCIVRSARMSHFRRFVCVIQLSKRGQNAYATIGWLRWNVHDNHWLVCRHCDRLDSVCARNRTSGNDRKISMELSCALIKSTKLAWKSICTYDMQRLQKTTTNNTNTKDYSVFTRTRFYRRFTQQWENCCRTIRCYSISFRFTICCCRCTTMTRGKIFGFRGTHAELHTRTALPGVWIVVRNAPPPKCTHAHTHTYARSYG